MVQTKEEFMSKKFHIVAKGKNTGRAEPCDARFRACPNGGEHQNFESSVEAERWAESKLDQEFDGSFNAINTDNLLNQDDHAAVQAAKIAARNAEIEADRQAALARGRQIDKEHAVASLNDLVERKAISKDAAQFLKNNPEFTTALSRFGRYGPGAPRPLKPRTGDESNTIELGLNRIAGSPQSLGYSDGAKIDPALLTEFQAIRSGTSKSSQTAGASEEGFSEIEINSLPSGDELRATQQARQAAANLEREQRKAEANRAARATALQDFTELVKSGNISREKAEFLKNNPEFTVELSRTGHRVTNRLMGGSIYGNDPISSGINYANSKKNGGSGLSLDSREKLIAFNQLK